MHPFEEMKAYVGFDDEDRRRLRAFWPRVVPHTESILDVFYERVLNTPHTLAVLGDADRTRRLRVSLRAWLEELLSGPWDEAYYARRQRIGRVHVQVGLIDHYMYTAMAIVKERLTQIVAAELPPAEMGALCGSIGKITSIDLAIMTRAYIATREERQARSLEELIVSHLPMQVLLVDAEGLVLASTRAAAAHLGTGPSRPHLRAALPLSLYDAAELDSHFTRAVASGHEVVLHRVDAVIDNRRRSFSVVLAPFTEPDQRVLVHVEELTEAIETEARLRRSEALAQLGALSAAVAHELRNPLAGISGALQVIAGSIPDADPKRMIMTKVLGQVTRRRHRPARLCAPQDPTPGPGGSRGGGPGGGGVGGGLAPRAGRPGQRTRRGPGRPGPRPPDPAEPGHQRGPGGGWPRHGAGRGEPRHGAGLGLRPRRAQGGRRAHLRAVLHHAHPGDRPRPRDLPQRRPVDGRRPVAREQRRRRRLHPPLRPRRLTPQNGTHERGPTNGDQRQRMGPGGKRLDLEI